MIRPLAPAFSARARSAHVYWLVAGLGLAVGLVWSTATAQVTAPGKTDPVQAATPLPSTAPSQEAQDLATRKRELEAMTRDIAVSNEAQARLQKEVSDLAKDQTTLTDQLMVTANRIQDNETKLSDIEERLLRLISDLKRQQGKLDARRSILVEVLGSLQRMSRKPPPALIVAPQDALSAVRAAIVMGAVLPELRLEVDALLADLTQMATLEAQARAQEAALKAEAARMMEDRNRLSLLIDEKKRRTVQSQQLLATEAQKLTELAAKAATLADLVAKLDRQAQSTALEAQGKGGQLAKLTPSQPFASLLGKLALPARGVMVQEFGADNGLDGEAQGISIATRAGARVTAPADGNVMYAGPYRAYGQLLILDAGDGYHIVLAGMDHLDVAAGQFVLGGEPVGTMGTKRLASAASPDMAVSQPILYIEFRKNSAPIDPSPWWAGPDDRKVHG